MKGVTLKLDNPQRHSGMYSRTLLIQDKDSAQSVAEKIAIQLKTLGSKVISRKYTYFYPYLDRYNETQTYIKVHKFALCVVWPLSDPLFISEPDEIQLWRYDDPVLGPRTLPQLDQPTAGKTLIPPAALFKCDFEKNALSVEVDGCNIPIGRTVVYIVKLPTEAGDNV